MSKWIRTSGQRRRQAFEWNFTRDDLAKLIFPLAAHEPQLRLAA